MGHAPPRNTPSPTPEITPRARTLTDLKGIRISLPHIFKSAFKGYDLPKTFRIEATFENGRYDCSIRASASSKYLEFFSEALYDGDRQIFGRSMHGINVRTDRAITEILKRVPVDDNRSVWGLVGHLVNISQEFRRELDDFCQYAIFAPQTAVMRGLAVDNRVIEPLGLTGSGLASAFEQALETLGKTDFGEIAKIIWQPGWADSIRTGAFDPEMVPGHINASGTLLYIRDKFMRVGRNYLGAFDASEGTLYLIFVATLLAHKQAPNVFALDNVDGTLNPKLVRNLISHIIKVCDKTVNSENKKQVFITSHHPSALDGFDIFNPEQRIFIASRVTDEPKNGDKIHRAKGSTHFRYFKPPSGVTAEQWIVSHGGRNLSEILLEGRIKDAL